MSKKLSSAPPPPSVNSRCFSSSYSESGRSMLEVLAVLAVAAVIGAGGVEGFTSARNKYRANELITEASGRALAVSQQLMVGKELKDTDFGGYPATDTGHGKFPEKPIPLAGDEFFKIPITGMDKPTCDQMKAIAGGSLRRVDCKDENGKVTADLIYQKDLSETAGIIPGDTDGTSTGGNAATRSYDNNRQGCEENGYQYCSNNICITKEETCESGSASCAQYPGTSTLNSGGHAGKADDGETMCYCPGGQVYSTTAGGCITACSGHGTLDANEDCVCQGGYTGVVCENQVDCGEHGTWTQDKCECDANWYGPLCDSDCDGFRANNGSCLMCSFDVAGILTSQTECDKCATSSTPRFMAGNGGCFLCSVNSKGPASETECDKCSNSSTPRFMGNDNKCYLCSYFYGVTTTENKCNKCATSSTPRFRDNNDTCYLCSYAGGVLASQTECNKCATSSKPREMWEGRCVLSSNLATPCDGFRNYDGKCYSCSSTSSPSTSQTECSRCDNTSTPRFMDNNGKCWPCSYASLDVRIFTNETECNKCSTSSTPRLMDHSDGRCYSCPNAPTLSASQTECNYCSNKFWSNDGICRWCSDSDSFLASETECNRCSTSYPRFRGNDSKCYLCSISSAITTNETECNKCKTSSTPRAMWQGRCVLSSKLATSCDGFRGIDGTCYSCSHASNVSADQSECNKCSTSSTPRFINNNGSCYLCSSSSSITNTNQSRCDMCKNTSTPREIWEGRCVLSSKLATSCNGFRGYNLACYSCSSSTDVSTSKDECDKCGSQRTYNTSTGKCSKA